jgi:ribonuclease PH
MGDPGGLRDWSISRGVNAWAEGSALVQAGRTRVLVTASVLPQVPRFLVGSGAGWVTAEYDMLPRSTQERRVREARRGRPDGRSLEISRLVGRAMRAAVETGYLGERTVALDCDVLQADGGTRTAAINGATVALVEALAWMKRKELMPGVPLRGLVGAVSVGLLHGRPVLDLDYQQDRDAEVDMNVVMTSTGEFVELQGTGEKTAFSSAQLDSMLELARSGIEGLFVLQREALGAELAGEAGLPGPAG